MAMFQIFTDRAGEYRWRLRANNAKSDCEHGIDLVKELSPTAEVQDQT